MTYVILMFSITLIGWWMGATTVAGEFNKAMIAPQCNNMQNQFSTDINSTTAQNALNNCATDNNSFFGRLLWSVLILGGALIYFVTGFSTIYILPLALLIAVFNYFILPNGIIYNPAIPDMISLPLITLYNMLLILTIMTFVRGGD